MWSYYSKQPYFSYAHFYIYYVNIKWASTNQTKNWKVLTKRKYTVCIIFNVNREPHTRPIFQELDVLNIYQIKFSDSSKGPKHQDSLMYFDPLSTYETCEWY